MKSNEFILYGLSEYKKVIDKVILELNASQCDFDIKLILTEALTNAFKHGNNMNKDKPIYLRYSYNNSSVKFEIEDCGNGLKNVIINDHLDNEDILEDKGRGLFIIKNLSDNIELKPNMLIIEKTLAV
ncbi:ATP-binding protein [Clostridium scatologenes]|uniref:Putative anti-sigma regulatory factor, serine/threonine protein kinase n=1 Tax=Clostridium scatologenes TaxID=1548 RepID=A0A0E3K5G2_CLOSL|nr:ATP-binding protein [Clostridium scatologenes]AKA72299.1 putative anti-sigma regulatory factor, serine/threonine protein kinase [Clostridium scatologenes]